MDEEGGDRAGAGPAADEASAREATDEEPARGAADEESAGGSADGDSAGGSADGDSAGGSADGESAGGAADGESAGGAADEESAGGPADEESAGGPADGASAREAADGTSAGGSADGDSADSYGGLLGAFPYALRSSTSLLFRSYVVLGGLAAALIGLLFGIGVLVLIGGTAGSSGGTLTFSRAFFVFVGLLTVAPVLAPVLAVARRHRRGSGDAGFDARMAGLGYAFLASLYLALVVSAPAGQREAPSGALAPLVEFLYSLPPAAGVVPPLAVVAAMWYVARR